MEFVNETPYPAGLFRSEEEKNVMYNALVGRIRYRLVDGQPLLLEKSPDSPRDLRRERYEDPYGRFEPDEIYGRTGTDLMVLGDAGGPDGPISSLHIRVTAGAYDTTLQVTGDRIWERRFGVGAPRPSAPLPFLTMPVTYSNAFGGQALTELGGVPFAHNPIGKGFYVSEADAIARPLPNIEDPHAPVSAWDDHPDPVGTAPYPQMWGLRLGKAVSYDPAGRVRFSPGENFFARAHPQLSGKPLATGDWVRLGGFDHKELIGFRLPACPLVAQIQLGTKEYTREPILDEVLIDLRTGHVDLSYRKLFHYPVRLRERRRATLRLKAE